MWPDWVIYCILGNFSKPVATIILPKFSTFLGNFCKFIKIFHFASEIIFGHLLQLVFRFFYWSHWSCTILIVGFHWSVWTSLCWNNMFYTSLLLWCYSWISLITWTGLILEGNVLRWDVFDEGILLISLKQALNQFALHSVTRLGNLSDFGQLLKPLATIILSKSSTLLGNFLEVSKSIIF